MVVFGFAVLCWLFMERIHPSFCALWAAATQEEGGRFWEAEHPNGGTSASPSFPPPPPPKTPNMPRILEDGLPVPLAFTLSGTNQRFYIHTQETNAVLTGIPDLSAPLTHLIVAEQTLLRQLTYFLASFDCTAQHISLFFLPPSLSLLYF